MNSTDLVITIRNNKTTPSSIVTSTNYFLPFFFTIHATAREECFKKVSFEKSLK